MYVTHESVLAGCIWAFKMSLAALQGRPSVVCCNLTVLCDNVNTVYTLILSRVGGYA